MPIIDVNRLAQAAREAWRQTGGTLSGVFSVGKDGVANAYVEGGVKMSAEDSQGHRDYDPFGKAGANTPYGGAGYAISTKQRGWYKAITPPLPIGPKAVTPEGSARLVSFSYVRGDPILGDQFSVSVHNNFGVNLTSKGGIGGGLFTPLPDCPVCKVGLNFFVFNPAVGKVTGPAFREVDKDIRRVEASAAYQKAKAEYDKKVAPKIDAAVAQYEAKVAPKLHVAQAKINALLAAEAKIDGPEALQAKVDALEAKVAGFLRPMAQAAEAKIDAFVEPKAQALDYHLKKLGYTGSW